MRSAALSHGVAVIVLLSGCTLVQQPDCERHIAIVDGEEVERCGPSTLPPCRGDGLTAHVSWAPPPATYHGVFVRLLEGQATVTSDIADEKGCADLEAPPGDYRIHATIRFEPDCGYEGDANVAYQGGEQRVDLPMHATC